MESESKNNSSKALESSSKNPTSSRSRNSSKAGSTAASRKSSRSSSTGSVPRKEIKNSDKSKIKGILANGSKSPKPVRSPKDKKTRRRSPSTSSRSSGPSGYATPRADDYDSDASGTGGLHQPMANLQYAIHTALTNKGESEKKLADQMLKSDSNKKLREALKKERIKGAQMFASLMEGGLTSGDQDVPQFKPFNKKKPPCSQEEFDRQLKSIMRNFPRFDGRCAEFLYFLIELEALRNTANITDEQLVRVLQNRLAGRLQKYFKNEMNRDNNVVDVLNRLGRDYVEVVDVAAEVEKCATFKFQFKNIADELIKLKEMMSLAYPHMPTDTLRQAYIQKVTDKLPSDVRLALVEEFERQRAREEVGFAPLSDHEVDSKIIRFCRGLERKQQAKPIFQVKASSRQSEFSESDASSCEGSQLGKPSKKISTSDEVKKFIKSVKQIAENAAKEKGEKQFHQVIVGRGGGANLESAPREKDFRNQRGNDRPQRPARQPNRFENQNKIFPPPNPNFMRQAPPRRPNGNEQFRREMIQPRQETRYSSGAPNRSPVQLANPKDPHYMQWVNEAKNANQVQYMGQKIRHDFRNATDNFKEALKQSREPFSPSQNQPFYRWIDGKYSVENNPEINYPVMRKVGNGIPQLSAEIMKRFNRCCYACGDPSCPRKGRKATYECVYQNKADSWLPCERCMRGFHLKKDCLALIKN